MSELVSGPFGEFSSGFTPGDDEWKNNGIDSPLPEGLKPFSHFIHVMQIAPRQQSAGGIILPDQRRDGEAFMNNIGRVVAIGPAAFRTPFWQERGYHRNAILDPELGDEIHVADSLPLPTVGDFIRMSGVRNRSFKFKGVWIIEIEDFNIRSIVAKEDVYAYRFWN